MSQQAVIDGLYAHLATDNGADGVYTLTAGRIFGGKPPQDAQLPLVTFSVVRDSPVGYFDSTDTDMEIAFEIRGPVEAGEKATRAIADRLVTLLHRQGVSVSGVSHAELWVIDRGRNSFEADAHLIVSRYRLLGVGY